MSDHVRKLNFDTELSGNTPVDHPKDDVYQDKNREVLPYHKNPTDTDPFNKNIKVEQHGDNVTTDFPHDDNPFQQKMTAKNQVPYYSEPQFSRGKGRKFLLAIILFILAAITVTALR